MTVHDLRPSSLKDRNWVVKVVQIDKQEWRRPQLVGKEYPNGHDGARYIK